jgi:Myb-like DNA-binding domain
MNIITNDLYTKAPSLKESPTIDARAWGRGWTKQKKSELEKEVMDCFKVHGFHDWSLIAEKVNRPPGACKSKWKFVVNPKIKRGKWSKIEDEKLMARMEKWGNNWHRVAEKMDGRTSKQCQERYQLYLNPAIKSEDWTKDEDDILRSTVSKVGSEGWSTISTFLPGRTSKYCRDRWRKISKVKEIPAIDTGSLKRKRGSEEGSLVVKERSLKKMKLTVALCEEEEEDKELNMYANILLHLALNSQSLDRNAINPSLLC